MVTPSDRKTLFLDLDHTLIVSVQKPSTENFSSGDQMTFTSLGITNYILKRPGVDQLLRSAVASNYEIVIFTAETRLYASSVIDWLDPNREFILHRLYRDACTIDAEGQYLKDLTVTGRRIDRSVVTDDSPTVYGDHSQNVIPVSPFYGDPKDVELLKILWFFEFEKQFEDLRLAVKNLSNMQIERKRRIQSKKKRRKRRIKTMCECQCRNGYEGVLWIDLLAGFFKYGGGLLIIALLFVFTFYCWCVGLVIE
ncbi:CTD small phosphatase-like protein [Rhynchospora pubera]|uniref:CTD small phosphatase-like protein n=1 Tax=Rhynchospora pubera TaxID=906938 RepID=A0AAV8FJ20_9POAL|nr:CTD small phosphatase-like protein [Rhynchospora pubera]